MNASPEFDRAGALDRCDNDSQLLKELVQMFFSEYPTALTAIHAAIAAGNADALRKSAHSIKGAAGNVGAVRAHSLALALEKMGASGNLATAKDTLKSFEQAVEAFKVTFASQKF
ncbi:MAG: Hpt domain-containing protein [Oligoflexia bacterium]|nr:Hpt domain-containing protein [Oligoflexia bacterium]